MSSYTVAVREKGKSGPFSFTGEDLRVHDTTRHSKPLTREQAQEAKRLLIERATKLGRPIEARIVRLVKTHD